MADIEGIEETCRMLDEVPKTVAVKGFFYGCEAAGKVFIKAIWPRTPVDIKAAINRAHGRRYKSKVTGEMIGGKGVLVGGLDAWTTIDSQGRFGLVEVGFGPSLSHLALWLEFGWMLTGHKPGKKPIRQIPPMHFMRDGFDASVDSAVDAFAEGLKSVVVTEYKQP